MDERSLILKAHGSEADDVIIVDKNPFTVGRRPENNAQIQRADVSGCHAEFRYERNTWWLQDNRSTNGTFLNGKRLSEATPVQMGDIIYFATKGYEVVPSLDSEKRDSDLFSTKVLPDSTEIKATMELLEIINEQRTFPYYQPILDLVTRRPIGVECLGRAASTSGPVGVGPLFWLATQQKVETQLSGKFRESALHCAACRYCWPEERERVKLFINMHPSEIRNAKFLQMIDEMSNSPINRWYHIVVEIPESLACNSQEMLGLIREIRARGMLVAYDDFGTGQSRIADLVNAPPDYLKLDRQLIAKLLTHRVKTGLVRSFVEACRELQVKTLAEGIETTEERDACIALGVDLGQGYLFSKPKPAYELFHKETNNLPNTCPFVKLNLLPAGLTSTTLIQANAL